MEEAEAEAEDACAPGEMCEDGLLDMEEQAVFFGGCTEDATTLWDIRCVLHIVPFLS